jgi:hypothetical protein
MESFNQFRIWALTICLLFQSGNGFYLPSSYPHKYGVCVLSLPSIRKCPLAITVCPSVSPKAVSRTRLRILASSSWEIGLKTLRSCLRCTPTRLRSFCVSRIHHGRGRRNPPWLGLGVLLSLICWAFFEGIFGIKILFCKIEGKNGKKWVVD